jgi:hypothetical protein
MTDVPLKTPVFEATVQYDVVRAKTARVNLGVSLQEGAKAAFLFVMEQHFLISIKKCH